MCKIDSEELARQRWERIKAAADLKEPDKVPLELLLDFGFRARWYGITTYEFFFDYEKAKKAIIKTATDFPTDFPPLPMFGTGSLIGLALRDYPDIARIAGVLTGPMHDILRDKYTRWPGREISPNSGSFQFIGGEFMKADEYDDFISDPFGFIAEVVVPRAHQSLERPGSAEAMAALIRAALEGLKYVEAVDSLVNGLIELGYPSLLAFITSVPLDFIGDFLRTIPGVLLDLRRRPDKVKEACDVLIKETMSRRIILTSRSVGFVLIPLHLNEYLSPKLYYEFYWPYLKNIITSFYNQGVKCQVAFEGRHDAYLESILELPKGWGIALFEKTDVRRAKRVLEGHTCVMGGVPPTLLLNATPSEVEEYVRKLLEEVMPGGGFILATSAPIPAETPPENVKSVIRAVEKYGVYRR
ncbi:MAG: uroporphyrinogen decarboxylase family protein [Candidatus Bathyarchaeia archaeon]